MGYAVKLQKSGGSLSAFTYVAYAYSSCGGSSRGYISNLQSRNTLTFPESINASVYCSSGSSWSVNDQGISTGQTLTFSGITQLIFNRTYTATSGQSVSATMTTVITIL